MKKMHRIMGPNGKVCQIVVELRKGSVVAILRYCNLTVKIPKNDLAI